MTRPAPSCGAGRLAGAAALIAVLTVASRLAGFGRTAVFTWVVQQSDLGGMYVIANTVPNIVFEIVAGGALASLVVPLLAGAVAADDRRAVAATTGALLTWTVSLLVPLAVLVMLFADPIISLISEGRSEAELAAGARMLRVFAPQLPLYGIGIVLTGVLQAHRRFAWPVIAPLLSSLTVVVVYVAFGAAQGRGVSVAQVGRSGELLLSGGTTLGVVVLSLSLVIPLRRLRLRPRFGYAFTADVRARVGGLATAGAVTVAAQQVALLVILNRVSGGPTGSPQVFNLAQAIFLLPWAVLAVPLAVASYPTLAAASAMRRRGWLPADPLRHGAGRAALQLPGRRGADRHRAADRCPLLPGQSGVDRCGDHRVRTGSARLRAVRDSVPRAVRAGRHPAGDRGDHPWLAGRSGRGVAVDGAASHRRSGARGDVRQLGGDAGARGAAARGGVAQRRPSRPHAARHGPGRPVASPVCSRRSPGWA